MYYLLFIVSLIVLAALHIKLLDWPRCFPVYGQFMIMTGLLNHAITHSLVINQYLEFPWRFFPLWTYNNILYDLLLLPAFGLLLIEWSTIKGKRISFALFFSLFIVLKDYILAEYTDLLSLFKWTLAHSMIGALITFYFWSALYFWLKKHII